MLIIAIAGFGEGGPGVGYRAFEDDGPFFWYSGTPFSDERFGIGVTDPACHIDPDACPSDDGKRFLKRILECLEAGGSHSDCFAYPNMLLWRELLEPEPEPFPWSLPVTERPSMTDERLWRWRLGEEMLAPELGALTGGTLLRGSL